MKLCSHVASEIVSKILLTSIAIGMAALGTESQDRETQELPSFIEPSFQTQASTYVPSSSSQKMGVPRMWYSEPMSSSTSTPTPLSRGRNEPFPSLQFVRANPAGSSQQPVSLPTHNRAIRQRRKDPSCDACRERKVKCDATDSTSCSECQSRGVRCHFTKESNRRISTTRQVQDLERQLGHALQENRQLRSILRRGVQTNIDEPGAPSFQPVDLGRSRSQSVQTCRNSSLEFARQQLSRNILGLFEPPRWRDFDTSHQSDWQRSSDIPAQDITSKAVESSADAWYWQMNLIDRDRFVSDCNELYRTGSFVLSQDPWIALFYAVLCSGLANFPEMVHLSSHARQVSARIATQAHIADLDVCRAALLLSQSYLDSSLKAEARFWIAIAVAQATTLGLDFADPQESAESREERETVWHCIYAWDRLISLDLIKPSLVPDSGNQLDQHQSGFAGPDFLHLRTLTAAARIADSLARCLQTVNLLPDVVLSLEHSINALENSLPATLNSNATSPTQPGTLWITTTLTNLRILLHRHKVSPNYSFLHRSSGLVQCAAAARRTARMIERSWQPMSSAFGDTYKYRSFENNDRLQDLAWTHALRTHSSAQFCLHLWRCVLFLSLRLDFQSAQTCMQAMYAIGILRPINIAAGRHVVFFLEELHQRIQTGADLAQLERDEEMIVYVSGDLQGDSYTAWVWSLNGGPVQPRGESTHMSLKLSSTPQSSWAQAPPAGRMHGQASGPAQIPDEHIWSHALEFLHMVEQEWVQQQRQRRMRGQRQVHGRALSLDGSLEKTSSALERVQRQSQPYEQGPKPTEDEVGAEKPWSPMPSLTAQQVEHQSQGSDVPKETPHVVKGSDIIPRLRPGSSTARSTTAGGQSFAQRMSIASLLGEDKPEYLQDHPATPSQQ